MIPHISAPFSRTSPPKRKSPAVWPVPTSGRSAELLLDKRGKATTGIPCHLLILRLGQDADQGLGSGRAHEHAARSVQLAVEPVDLVAEGLGELLGRDRHVLLALRPPGHDGRSLGE